MIATGHVCDDPLVVGNKHGVGVVIATVEPLLNITFDRIHANDIGCEIEVPHKVIAVRIPCEVEIAHGDMRTACAKHHLAVSEARGAYLSVLQ